MELHACGEFLPQACTLKASLGRRPILACVDEVGLRLHVQADCHLLFKASSPVVGLHADTRLPDHLFDVRGAWGVRRITAASCLVPGPLPGALASLSGWPSLF